MGLESSCLGAALPAPIAGNMQDYGRDPLDYMTRCARQGQEILPIAFDDELICLLTNPADITTVLKDRTLFVKGQASHMLRGLLGNGLITSEGEFWQRQRRLTQPVFHQQRIDRYGATMVDYTKQMLQSWRDGDLRNLHDEMMRLTLNIVMKTIFDQDLSDLQANQIAQVLDTYMQWFAAASAQSPDPETGMSPDQNLDQNLDQNPDQTAIDLLDQTLYAILAQRRADGEDKDDLLAMLMQIQDADDGSRMSDRQLRDEVASLMLAGHETTANTLSWTWMLLAQHPSVQAKLTQELRTVLNGRSPTVADLPQLSYTNQVIREAMRLYPPVTDMDREAAQDCELGGYRIPQGTTLLISQWVMHRDPRYFTEPDVFMPERWTAELEKHLPRGVYFPFGDGPRVCIGKGFAVMEAALILATVAQAFQLDLLPDQVIELQPSVTLRPKQGIQVRLNRIDRD